MIVMSFEQCRALRHLCLAGAYFNRWFSEVVMVKPKTAVGVVLPFPTSRETPGIQSDHPIYQILERADRLMTALSVLRSSCTAMMVGVPIRNAAEILAQADVALRQAENVVDRKRWRPSRPAMFGKYRRDESENLDRVEGMPN
jgi:hypothetical protein